MATLVSSAGVFLEIRDLCVTYSSGSGKKVRAVEGVHLQVRPGEVLGILGESGSGKSTLANSVLGLLRPQANCGRGEILFGGRDLLKLSEGELCAVRGREISLIPQDPALALNPVMNVGDQISEVLRAHLALSGRERRSRVRDLLREVGFDSPDEVYCAYPHQLSGGQRQRIVIAQALSCRPALIIADEPTSKLDASLRADVVELLFEIRREHGTSLIVISHDPTVFLGFADRIAVMYAGMIVEVGNCEEIFRRPLHPYTEALLRLAKPSFAFPISETRKHLPVIEGELPDPTAIPAGCVFEPRCAVRLKQCAREIPRELKPEPARSVSCLKYGE